MAQRWLIWDSRARFKAPPFLRGSRPGGPGGPGVHHTGDDLPAVCDEDL